MNYKQKQRVEHILQFLEYDEITDDQHKWIVDFEEQFLRCGYLSDRQIKIMESIFQQVA